MEANTERSTSSHNPCLFEITAMQHDDSNVHSTTSGQQDSSPGIITGSMQHDHLEFSAPVAMQADVTTGVFPTETTDESPPTTNILVLGMLYGTDDSTTKGQLGRDHARCKALEATSTSRVYSTDLTHAADLAQPGRHIQHDFGTYGVLSVMDSEWPGVIFKHVIMDYFYTPNSWHEEHWKEDMYTTTLFTMAKRGALTPR